MKTSTDLNLTISRLLSYALDRGLITPLDTAYAANRILAMLGEANFSPVKIDEKFHTPAEILEDLCRFAMGKGLLEEGNKDAQDQFDTELMACLTPRPSEVVGEFQRLYEQSPKAATDYYYALSRSTNYIRVDRIEKDRKWTAPTPYGDLTITINLSKPEKDPKAIAAARNAPKSGYPACALCRENEGYLGSANQAARGNHRLVPITLDGEQWYLQYSPYVYYNEHCIVLSQEHRPMKVDRASFRRLLEFESILPHYFIGSNADLPIVGGSILSHDHFQGGAEELPMARAGIREKIGFAGFEDIDAGILNWPMSVIRIKGKDRDRMVELADKILAVWRGYSDESVDVLAETDGTPHNTITPIARRRGADFELDLVLRNNRTTEEHPLGLFHPHAEYHNIKKENIGLIEVMGLAILPPRLLTETGLLQEALADEGRAADIMARPEMEKHQAWYEELKARNIPADGLEKAIQDSIGEKFGKILGNAGVFKDDEPGREAFRKFCAGVR